MPMLKSSSSSKDLWLHYNLTTVLVKNVIFHLAI